MQQLGKALKDIPIEKIYVGMKVGFNSELSKSGVWQGKVISVKNNVPLWTYKYPYQNASSLSPVFAVLDVGNSITIDWEDGPLGSYAHSSLSSVCFAE